MASFDIFDATEVTINVGGFPIESGFADGEFLRVEQAEDGFLTVVGTDGSVTRSKSNNRMATVTIILMSSSDGNAILSTLHNTDLKASNGAGVVPILIRDRQGTTLMAGAKAWVIKAPDASFDRTATPREWTIGVADFERFDGGN